MITKLCIEIDCERDVCILQYLLHGWRASSTVYTLIYVCTVRICIYTVRLICTEERLLATEPLGPNVLTPLCAAARGVPGGTNEKK